MIRIARKVVVLAGEIAVAAVHALTAWTLAAAAMSLALWQTRPPEAALAAHAVAVPVAFALVSFVYFRRTHALRPLAAAVLFGIVVFAMDALALRVFQRTTDARALVLGVTLPAFVAMLSSWLFGIASSITAQSEPRGDEIARYHGYCVKSSPSDAALFASRRSGSTAKISCTVRRSEL